MNRAKIEKSIFDIRNYTKHNIDLHQSHHFLYDLPLNKNLCKVEYIVLGINPGETKLDFEYPGPTEETSLFDFHDVANIPRSPSSIKWLELAEYYCNTPNAVLGEIFFWSAPDMKVTKDRYGDIWKSRHLPFCVEKLSLLFGEYSPKAIIFTGLSAEKNLANLFCLKKQHSFVTSNGRRLVEKYMMEEIPWYITSHWTGSYGLTDEDRKFIKNSIHAT